MADIMEDMGTDNYQRKEKKKEKNEFDECWYLNDDSLSLSHHTKERKQGGKRDRCFFIKEIEEEKSKF